MATDFSSLDTMDENIEVGSALDPKKEKQKEERKQEAAEVNDAMEAFARKLKEDPALKGKLYAYSNSIEVINSCGYGEGGGLVNAAEKGAEKRQLQATPQIVGYVIKNIGTFPIPFKNEVWVKNAEGVYEGEMVEDSIAPGETKALTKKIFALLAITPEVSLKVANGTVKSPRIITLKKCKTPEDALNRYTFSFPQNSGLTVNSSKFKVAIANRREVEIDGVKTTEWKIKPEFVQTFGYLENPKARTIRTKANKGDSAELRRESIAAYANEMFNQGM